MPGTASSRFTALDVFRGMTICLMIVVNTPGNEETTYAPLHHAMWNGFTPTDLVFPSFMFAVGNAMSFVSRKWSQMSPGAVLSKIIKRSFLIFILGFLMYWFPFFHLSDSGLVMNPLSQTRIFGVLQRIAIAYFFAAIMIYYFKPRTVVIVSVLILLLYWPLLYFFGTGPDPLDIHANAVLKLDTWLIGSNHLYTGEGFPFDPEGLLSTFPAIVNVTAGYFAGVYIQKNGKTFEGLAKLLMVGFVFLIIAYWWNLGFPINKKLWTSSFVVHTIGLDLMILSLIIYYTDFKHKQTGVYFFEVFGKNPLFIYLLSELIVVVLFIISVDDTSLYHRMYTNVFSYAGNYFGSFLFAVSYMLFCWFIGYILDRKKIYIRV